MGRRKGGDGGSTGDRRAAALMAAALAVLGKRDARGSALGLRSDEEKVKNASELAEMV